MDFLWNSGAELIAVLLGGIATWAVTKFTGKEIEARHREALHSAILTGIGFARSKLTGSGPALDEKAIVQQAREYVEGSVPDALKHFGLDKASGRLLEMIAAKIGLVVPNI